MPEGKNTATFEWKGGKYLLMVDYFSRFIEIAKLTGESSADIIRHMKSIIARHGIPQEMFTDNGPQFAAAEFKQFADSYGIFTRLVVLAILSQTERRSEPSKPSSICLKRQKIHTMLYLYIELLHCKMVTALQTFL